MDEKNAFYCAGLLSMEELHSGKGNSHPHRPPPPAVYTDTREVAEWLLSEMVHIPTIVSF